jgi:hypothetical protein
MDERKEIEILEYIVKHPLCIEILHDAFKALKSDPNILITEALNEGLSEWDK